MKCWEKDCSVEDGQPGGGVGLPLLLPTVVDLALSMITMQGVDDLGRLKLATWVVFSIIQRENGYPTFVAI
jgi:hypothetical protein